MRKLGGTPMQSIKSEIRSSLKTMLIPAMSGMIMTFLFQLVDTYFIGKLGAVELTAVSFTYPIYFAMISVFMGLSVGAGASVGKAFGMDDHKKVKSLTITALILSLIIGLLLSAFVYITRHNLYTILGANTNITHLIDSYILVIIIGMPALMIALTGMAALRATGRATIPDLTMGIGGIINLVLDYLLIFGYGNIPAMGIRGAAIATVISWIFVLFVIIIILVLRGPLKTKGHGLQFIKNSNSILKVGIPAIGVQLVVPVAIGIMTRFVSQYGPEAVAAFGIATKIESLALTLILAMSIVLVPMAAQRYGARQKEHLDEIIALAGKTSTYWSTLLYIIILLFSKQIAGIFTDAEPIIKAVQTYLLIIGLSYPLFGITHITNALFNAVDKPMRSLKITVVKYTIVLMPLILIGSKINLNFIWIAIAFSHIIGGIYASHLFRKWMSDENSAYANVNTFSEYLEDIKHLKQKMISK